MCRMQNDPLKTKRPRVIKWVLNWPWRKKGPVEAYYRHLSGGRCVRDRRNLWRNILPFIFFPPRRKFPQKFSADVTTGIIAAFACKLQEKNLKDIQIGTAKGIKLFILFLRRGKL